MNYMSKSGDQYHFINDSLDRAIETSLKEYETLRTEIAQRSQNGIQIIFLVLAAIATIISFTLPQFVTFVTSEDITIQSIQQPQKTEATLENKINNPALVIETEKWGKIMIKSPDKSNKSSLDLSNLQKNFKINRTTEATGANTAKWVFVFIYGFIIPLLSFYALNTVIANARGIVIIGNYLAYNVESKINDYFLKKQENFDKYKKRPFRLSIFKKSRKQTLAFKPPLNWELFVRKNKEFVITEFLYIYLFFSVMIVGSYNFAIWITSFTNNQGSFTFHYSVLTLFILNNFNVLPIIVMIRYWLLLEKEVKSLLFKPNHQKSGVLSECLWELIVFAMLFLVIILFEIWYSRSINIPPILKEIYLRCIIISTLYQLLLSYYFLYLWRIRNIANLKKSYSDLTSRQKRRLNGNLRLLFKDLRNLAKNSLILKILLYVLPVVQIFVAIIILVWIYRN